jgi:hypothetical protein
MPGKMAGSDPRPSVRVTRGAGSGQHLASVLQEGRETRALVPVWDSSGESRIQRFVIPLLWQIDSRCFSLQNPLSAVGIAAAVLLAQPR